jgi:hypothetical protein
LSRLEETFTPVAIDLEFGWNESVRPKPATDENEPRMKHG